MSNFKNSEDEIRQGKYLNAFLYFLIAALLTLTPVLWFDNKNLRAENVELLRVAQAREDKKDAQCDSTIEKMTIRFRDDIRAQQEEFRVFRDETISDMREGRERSEILSTQSRKAARKFQVESEKTKQFSNQIDSVTEKLIK